MSDSESSPVFFFDNDDPEMQRAHERARDSFRHFWRELAWERRRIVPALDLACVKSPFSDSDDEAAEVEQMWVSDVDFNGKLISGTLINSPQWVTSVEEGDVVRMPIGRITDWMYAISERVYGAFTVNLMRSRMAPAERAQHDEAWGLDFGDPGVIDFATDPDAPHPMDVNMSESLAEHLSSDPTNVHQTDDEGWTYLHQMSLAGSSHCVQVLLQHGADVNAVTGHGMTPLQLANSLGWADVSRLLVENGAR